jgi:hypothetical protein
MIFEYFFEESQSQSGTQLKTPVSLDKTYISHLHFENNKKSADLRNISKPLYAYNLKNIDI